MTLTPKENRLTPAQEATLNEFPDIKIDSIEDCPKCDGSGELQPDVQCKACIGTGIKHFDGIENPNSVCAICGGTGSIKGGPTDSRKDSICFCKSQVKQELETPMKRYKNQDGQMIEDVNGGWCVFSDVQGTEQEIKDWMRKHARHADYPKCQIRKTGKCTCGLNNYITKSITDVGK